MTAVTVISRDNWFIQWSIVERYSARIRIPGPTSNAAVPAQPIADSFGGSELARISRHKRTSAESPRNLPNLLFTLSVAGGSVKGDAHGSWLRPARIRRVRHPVGDHRMAARPTLRVAVIAFPRSRVSCVAHRMVWSRLGQRRPRGRGPPLTTVNGEDAGSLGRGPSPHHTKDVNDLGQNLPEPTV